MVALLAIAVGLLLDAGAGTAAAAPAWEVDSYTAPTNVAPGGPGEYRILVRNVTDTATRIVDAEPGTVRVRLDPPPGLSVTSIGNDFFWVGRGAMWSCDLPSLTCETNDVVHSLRTAFPIIVGFSVDPGASGELDSVLTVSGGNIGDPVSVSLPTPVGEALPGFGVVDGSFVADAFDRSGTQLRQAGAHPLRATSAFSLNLKEMTDGTLKWHRAVELPHHVEVDLPRGFVGNPNAVPKCTNQQLIAPDGGCPSNTQVGVVDVATSQTAVPTQKHLPLFNMVPSRGVLADFAFQINANPIHLRAYLNPVDYSVRVRVDPITELEATRAQKVTLWGVPADPAHDADRFLPHKTNAGQPNPADPFGPDIPIPSTLPPVPFLTLPSECGVAAVTRMRMASWDSPGQELEYESEPQFVTGCERQRFEAGVSVAVDSSRPDAATGMELDLHLRQFDQAKGVGAPPLRDATVSLPEGMTINPAAADGLEACSDEQLAFKTDRRIGCPDGSKVGSVVAESPALEDPVEGGVYVRSQNSDDPGSGEMFRLAIVVEDRERGLLVKLPGSVSADPQTGRLVTRFRENPQLPVERIKVRLKGGARGVLAMPDSCGVKQVVAQLSSWGGHRVEVADSFTVDCPAGGTFAPLFSAGSVSPTGGEFSPFVVRVERGEGDQHLAGVQIDMPKGLLAKLRGVELCPDAVAGDGTPGTCPAGSRIGTATVGAGSGNPFYLQGPVFLTGPYNGGPYGLSVQVHAKAGPFELGMVKVRNALRVDPRTAQVTVVSDRLPQIVKGVPVRLREVDVDVDRPGFTLNPTSCAEQQVAAKLSSAQGMAVERSARFGIGDCATLAFTPKTKMRLSGRRQTRTGGHPGLRAVVTQPAGQANIESAKVTLPRSLALDAINAYDPALVCDYDRAQTANCPPSSIIGKAVAHTPVLDNPLTGNVHLVQGIKFGKAGNRIRTLPTLLVKLRGQVAIDLRAQTSTSKNGRLITTFPTVPDAPVSKFTIDINGGNKGILAVTRTRKTKLNLCTTKQTANINTNAHNNKQANYPTTIKTPCATKASKRRKR